jgi:hypothetical protein
MGVLPVAKRSSLHRVDEFSLADVAVVARDPATAERCAHLQLNPSGLQVAFTTQKRDGVERWYQSLEGAGSFVPRKQFFDWRSDLCLLLEQFHAL